MKKKLQSHRGETLTEVLVAVLVTALAICLLAGMVQYSMIINAKIRQEDAGDHGFYPALSDVETHEFGPGDGGSITVHVTNGPSNKAIPNVYLDTQADSGLAVYGKEG